MYSQHQDKTPSTSRFVAGQPSIGRTTSRHVGHFCVPRVCIDTIELTPTPLQQTAQ